MTDYPDVLAEIALDVWLLSREGVRSTSVLAEGRVWERAIGRILRRDDFTRHQDVGETSLFGHGSASGVAHEIDAAASGRNCSVIVECKSKVGGATKADLALFHEKTLDFYFERPHAVGNQRWWRFVISSSPVADSVRAFGIQLGLVVCDPAYLPLPTILWTACRPNADQHLRERLLEEAVRMGESALMPMQRRWAWDPDTGDIRIKPKPLKSSEIDDLVWLQAELGSDIIDIYHRRPGYLKVRLSELRKAIKEIL